MGDSSRMILPAEEPLPVKRPSEKNAAVTMRDVATQSGFSPATVSIVLNNAPLARYIAPATKKRIEEVARKMHGLDALLATVQMPGGIPVATMAIDKAGAVNAAIFAAEILGLSDAEIARKLVAHKEELVKSVAEKNARLQKQISENK